MRLRSRSLVYQKWQSEHTSMIRFDRPASITIFFNRLEIVRVQRPTFGVAAAWRYCCCYGGDESTSPTGESQMSKKKMSGVG